MLQFQRCDYDISLRFRVDNLHEFFGPTQDEHQKRRVTEPFGPGWQLELKVESKPADDILWMHFKMPTRSPIPLKYSITVTSLLGIKCYSSRTACIECGDRQPKAVWILRRIKHWEMIDALRRDDAVIISFTVTTTQGPSATSSPTLSVLHRLITGEQSGVTDVKFITYCTRRSSVDFLNTRNVMLLFHSLWLRAIICLITDYVDSDSDFEDEVDDEVDDDDEVEGDAEEQDVEETMEAEECTNDTNEMIVDDPSQTKPVAEGNKVSTKPDGDILKSVPCDSVTQSSESNSLTVIVHGAASTTWEALLFYLYTGTVTFAPLTSIGSSRRRVMSLHHKVGVMFAHRRVLYPDIIRKLELEHLKTLALEHLQSQLNPTTILTEVFSAFTSRYEEVKEMELAVLAKHWHQLKDTPALEERIEEVIGEPHASQIVSAIFKRLSMTEN
ncbi:hypothetical protein A0H81_01509 [Grifola frondosa]|uniref:BTB domain-containing protein n=1 Tax=Grifola frondosa TaxID=5627 RepID=A0A1C7MRL3_GRIFR|nr:hypothetical protein A0H81_01509 [Grifola frondosa]